MPGISSQSSKNATFLLKIRKNYTLAHKNYESKYYQQLNQKIETAPQKLKPLAIHCFKTATKKQQLILY